MSSPAEGATYRFDHFEVDGRAFELRAHGTPAAVQPKALELLLLLLEERDRMVPKEELFTRLWRDRDVGDAALAHCLRSARVALGDDARRPRYLQTLHGRGLRFNPEVVVTVDEDPVHVVADPRRPPGARPLPEPSSGRRTGWPVVAVTTGAALLVVILVALLFLRGESPWTRAAAPEGAAAGGETPPVIALLPFAPTRPDPELDLLATALGESIVRALSDRGLVVHGPDEMRALALAAGSLAEIAMASGADLLVSGTLSARLGPGPVPLVVTLHDLRPPGAKEEADSLELPVPSLDDAAAFDAFALVQRHLVDWLAEAAGADPAATPAATTLAADPQAYRLYLLGLRWLAEPGCEAEARAELVDRSLSLGPDFAPAWELAARIHHRLGASCLFGPSHLAVARSAAERATVLAPRALAPGLMVGQLDLEAGRIEAAHRTARRLAGRFPHHPAPACLEARALTAGGLVEAAGAALDLCATTRGSPTGGWSEPPETLLLLGESERFLATTERAATFRGRYSRGFALWLAGRPGDARATVEPIFSEAPAEIWGRLAHSLLALIEQRPAEAATIARALAREQAAVRFRNGELTYRLAQLLALAGERGEAVEQLRLASTQGYHCAPCLAADPSFAALRDDADFAALVERAAALSIALGRRLDL